jgi:hypothetical protein
MTIVIAHRPQRRDVESRNNMTSPRFSACALLVLMTAASARAQTSPPQTPLPAPVPDAAAPAAATPRLSFAYGVRFGPSFTSLTSVETFDPTDVGVAAEPTMNFGGFFIFGAGLPLSLQPEVLFAAKGQRIRDKNAPPVTGNNGETKEAPADRVVLLRYLEIPVLLRLARQTHERTSLYLLGGPAVAFRRNAVIREVADPGRRVDIDEQVNTQNLLLIIGGGLQHKRWMVDARISRGIRNVAVDSEPGSVKTNAFSVLMGVRL